MAHDPSELAEAVRAAVIEALLEAYEDAGVRGLCGEGRLEVAVGAARALDLSSVVESLEVAPSRSTRET